MAAAGGPGPERPEVPPGRGQLSPSAPGQSPGPEVLDGPGEPAEPRPEEPQPGEPQQPGPEEPSEPEVAAGPPGPSEPPGPSGPEAAEGPPGPSESLEPWEPPEPPGTEIAEGPRGPSKPSEPWEPPEPPGPEIAEGRPGSSEPSAPEVAAGPPGPSEAAPAAGGAGEEAAAVASSGNGATGETAPAARPEETPVPAGEAERRSAEQLDVTEEGEEERRERAELLEQHRGLAGERERLRQASTRLQLRLGELLRLRRGEGPRVEAGADADGPQRYGERLRRLQELREQREREAGARREREAAACREREAARRRVGEERQARAQAEWAAFQARKKAVTVFSLGRRLGGREAATTAVERIQAREGDKEQQVREARVENIKLKHEIRMLETILKAQGELAEGQHFMDFEHMKKENQKHSEKISDLGEEILKLKKKVSKAVHILSQFREKLQFVEAENQDRKAELMDMETVLAQKRDILTKTKQARDRLRRNNLKLQQKCGLLGNEILLRDFEKNVDTAELLCQQLETLKRHHAGVILTCRGIQKKIKEANSSFLAEHDQRKERMGKNKLRSFP